MDFPVWEDENVLVLDGSDVYTTVKMFLLPLNSTLKNSKFDVMYM